MAYFRNDLISRPGYAGVGAYVDTVGDVRTRGALTRFAQKPMSGWTDTVGDVAKGALSFFGAQQRAAGGQEALQQALTAQQAQPAPVSTGPSTTTLLVGAGAVGLVAFLLLRRKRKT